MYRFWYDFDAAPEKRDKAPMLENIEKRLSSIYEDWKILNYTVEMHRSFEDFWSSNLHIMDRVAKLYKQAETKGTMTMPKIEELLTNEDKKEVGMKVAKAALKISEQLMKTTETRFMLKAKNKDRKV